MAVTGNLQIKNEKYYAVINLYDEFGNRKQKWISTDLPEKGNKKKAERFLRQTLEEYSAYDISYPNITVAEYFSEWLKMVEFEVKPNTYRSYCGNMTNHIIPYFEKKKILLHRLKPYHLEDYYRYKTNNKSDKSCKALSPTTIKHHHQNISKALSDALRRGLIATNPASVARTPRTKKYKAKFLNPEQLNSLLLLFKNTVIELPVILTSVYGFRRSEVLGLKWENIDFVNRSITVCETLQQHTGGSYTDTTKTDSSYRTLPMTEGVYELLTQQKENQEVKKALLGAYYVDNGYVCTWENGEIIEPNYLTRTFHSVISKSTLPVIRFHDLRHSVASNLLAKGFSIVQVQEWLGHGSASTTLNFYAHTDKSSKLAVAAGLEDMISFAPKSNTRTKSNREKTSLKVI